MVRQDKRINWITSGFMVAFHIGAIAALFMFSWKALFVGSSLYWVAGSFGIGLGYHRLLTHRGFKCPKWFEYFLTVCAHAGARRRSDFLGGHAPRASSADRQARRSAQPARRRLLGAHGLDHERRGPAQQSIEACCPTFPIFAKTSSTLDQRVALGSDGSGRPDPAGHRRLEVWCSGESSCAPYSCCTRPGS